MALPLIGYKSIIPDGTLTDPGTASGYSINNIKDLKSYTLWLSSVKTTPIFIDLTLPGADSADYVALVNTNLATEGASIRIFADTFSPPTTARTALTAVTSDGAFLLTFTDPGPLDFWRIRLSASGGSFINFPYIGQVFLGLKTELPHFISSDFDPFFDQVEVASQRSEGGHYLGALLRGHRHRGTISFGAAGAPRTSYTSTINAFLDYAALRKPFVFSLDTADADFDTARYLKVPDEATIDRRAVGGAWANLELSLPVEEAFSEVAA